MQQVMTFSMAMKARKKEGKSDGGSVRGSNFVVGAAFSPSLFFSFPARELDSFMGNERTHKKRTMVTNLDALYTSVNLRL